MGLRSQPGPEDTRHLAGSDPAHPGRSRAGCFAIDRDGATASPVTSVMAGGRGPADPSDVRLCLEISQIAGFIILCKLQGGGEGKKERMGTLTTLTAAGQYLIFNQVPKTDFKGHLS